MLSNPTKPVILLRLRRRCHTIAMINHLMRPSKRRWWNHPMLKIENKKVASHIYLETLNKAKKVYLPSMSSYPNECTTPSFVIAISGLL